MLKLHTSHLFQKFQKVINSSSVMTANHIYYPKNQLSVLIQSGLMTSIVVWSLSEESNRRHNVLFVYKQCSKPKGQQVWVPISVKLIFSWVRCLKLPNKNKKMNNFTIKFYLFLTFIYPHICVFVNMAHLFIH